MPNGAEHSFLSHLWSDLRLILHHCVITLTLLGCLLVGGFAIRGLKVSLPDHDYSWFETCELNTAMILMAEFGTYAIVITAIRLLASIREEVQRLQPPVNGVNQPLPQPVPVINNPPQEPGT
jgi:hypothetical protein